MKPLILIAHRLKCTGAGCGILAMLWGTIPRYAQTQTEAEWKRTKPMRGAKTQGWSLSKRGRPRI